VSLSPKLVFRGLLFLVLPAVGLFEPQGLQLQRGLSRRRHSRNRRWNRGLRRILLPPNHRVLVWLGPALAPSDLASHRRWNCVRNRYISTQFFNPYVDRVTRRFKKL
jgi:hypothetical protein